jgi:leader peptidase (prepilin peptidase) / N-methyltransferase
VTSFVALPLACRLGALFAIGVLLGHFANLAAFALSERPGRNPWSRQFPLSGVGRWISRLPLAGWLLAGRTASAASAASPAEARLERGFWVRPLLVELLMGGLCVALYWFQIDQGWLFPPGPVGPGRSVEPSAITWNVMHAVLAAHLLLIAFMLAATLIDIDEQIIPDAITVTGTALGLALSAAYAWVLPPAVVHFQAATKVQFVYLTTFAAPYARYPTVTWPEFLVGRPQLLTLYAALAIYTFGCVSLLPWLWRPGRGVERAVQLLGAYAMRARNWPTVLVLWVCGSAAIGEVWWLSGPNWVGLSTSLIGMAVGGGMIWAVRIVASLALGREAMGFGDVTLMSMIGALLGWHACLAIFFLAPFPALVVGLLRLALGGQREIPYGPFICLAALTVIAFWQPIWLGTADNGYHGLAWLLSLPAIGSSLAPLPPPFDKPGGLVLEMLIGGLVLMAILLPLVRMVFDFFRRPARAGQ